MLPDLQTSSTEGQSEASVELVNAQNGTEPIPLDVPTSSTRGEIPKSLTIETMRMVACLAGVRLPGLSFPGHICACVVNIGQAVAFAFLGVYTAASEPSAGSSKLQSFVETLLFIALFGCGIVYTQWFAYSRYVRGKGGRLSPHLAGWLERGAPGWSSRFAAIFIPTAGFVVKDVPVVIVEDGWLAGLQLLVYLPMQISPVLLGVLSCYLLAAPHIDKIQQTILAAGDSIGMDPGNLMVSENPMRTTSFSTRSSTLTSLEESRCSVTDSLSLVKERLKSLDGNIKRDARIPTIFFILPCFFFYLMHLLFHVWILWDVYADTYDDDDGIVGSQRGTSKAQLLAYFGGSAVFDVGSLLVIISPALYTNSVADRLVVVILDTFCCAPADDGGANAAAFAMWLQKAELGWSLAFFRPSLRVLRVSLTSTAIVIITLITRSINS